VALYFGMYRSTQALVSSEQQQFAAVRRRIFDGEARIERLKKFRATLPEAGKRLALLERDYTPPRRQAFSQAAKLVRRVTEESGIQLASVAYKLDNNVSGPLQRLGLVIKVAGSFPGLLRFAHGLETASDLMVIRSFNIAVGDNRVLELRLTADLYLTP
jgi:Tfp pilus assembly protein PilO